MSKVQIMKATQRLAISKKTVQSIVFMLSLIFCQNIYAQNIYVSPTGNDANSGSFENPVKTFQKGADLAKKQRSGTVEFADGEYVFRQTVVLDASYSGITFKATSGATPIFTSLVQVTGWSTHSGSIMKANLPSGISHVRYLQDKSENWMERSATNSFTTKEAAGGDDDGCIECNNYTPATQSDMSNIQYPSSFSTPDWSKVAQYDLRSYTLPWGIDVLPLVSVNTSQRRISTAVPALYDLRVDGSGESTPKAWILNSIAGITSPSEWASIDGVLYLYPSSGTSDIYVPQLTELISVDAGGDGNSWSGTPVQNIVFDGITFTGGDFRPFESTDVTAQHDWMGVDVPDGLLQIRNSSNITVQNCTFSKSGGTGLRIDRYAQNHLITNNTLTYLGRGGINIAGRGPGYGDVSTNNEISLNHLEYIGMEYWASIAIILDNSSNNDVHQNYIANTYFTGIAIIGPRQLMFASLNEGAAAFYVGREFHFREVEPSVVSFIAANGGTLDGSEAAMKFVYNYGNSIKENYFVDVCTGLGMFTNGQFYLSGTQKGITPEIKTNYIERNYFYDSYEHSFNDYVLYSDSDQEDCNYIGNMIQGVQNAGNDPEPLPLLAVFGQWAETENLGAGQIRVSANVTESSTFCNDECGHTIGIDFVEEGAVINGVGGDAKFLSIYRSMYTAICEENLTHLSSPLAGAQTMRDRLSAVITNLGGTLSSEKLIITSATTITTDDKIAVYPNPASWNVTAKRKLNTPTNYTVHNASGQIIIQKEVYSSDLNIDLTSIVNGLHILRIDNQIWRFVKVN